MADTYSQLIVHIVFAVKGRANLISKDWKVELYKYISGIVTNQQQKLLVIDGVEDHVHLLIGFKPTCTISDLVRDIKMNSTKWINDKRFINGKFAWQNGFGAFSVSYSRVDSVIRYILNQEEHHRRNSFRKEYLQFLEEYQIEYNTEYLLEDYGN